MTTSIIDFAERTLEVHLFPWQRDCLEAYERGAMPTPMPAPMPLAKQAGRAFVANIIKKWEEQS